LTLFRSGSSLSLNIRNFELPNAGAGVRVGAYSTFLEIGGYQPGSGI